MIIHNIFKRNATVSVVIRYGLLVLLSSLCYFFTRSGSFVFDDTVAIVKNQDITNPETPLTEIFRHDFWGANLIDSTSHKSYRPLTILSFRQEVKWASEGRLDATGMKTTNWVLHTVIGLLLPEFFRVVSGKQRRAFRDKRGAGGIEFEYWAAVLFVVHPIHTEAVAGIVGRAELLAALWFVLAVMIYGNLFRGQQSFVKHVATLTTVLLLTILSVLSKETGITVLVTCAALDILTHVKLENPIRTFFRSKSLLLRTTVLFLITCTILYVRLWIQDFTRPQFRDKDNLVAVSTGLTKFLSQNYLYCLNLWLLLCPDWLSFDWALESIPLVESFRDYRIAFIVIFYVFLAAAIVRGRTESAVLKGLALLIVPFLPASGIIRVGFVIAERVLYIPSLGFCYLVAYGFSRVYNRLDTRRARITLRSGFVLVCTLFVLRTIQRSSYWSSEHTLFRSALRVVPNNAKVHYNIARLATDEGDKRTAFSFYRQAIALYPEYEAAHMNLGNLYRDEHNYPKALYHLKKAIEYHEDFHTAWMNLGIVHAAMRNHKEALESYRQALRRQKHYPNCLFNLGNLYNDMGNQSAALATWAETILQDPRHIKAWTNMINVYDAANRQQEILTVTAQALQHLPHNPTLLSARATALAKLGRFSEAEQIYGQLIAANPRVEKYHQNMGVLYHRWGKLDQAERMYREALRLNPRSEMAKSNLSKLLAQRQQQQQRHK